MVGIVIGSVFLFCGLVKWVTKVLSDRGSDKRTSPHDEVLPKTGKGKTVNPNATWGWGRASLTSLKDGFNSTFRRASFRESRKNRGGVGTTENEPIGVHEMSLFQLAQQEKGGTVGNTISATAAQGALVPVGGGGTAGGVKTYFKMAFWGLMASLLRLRLNIGS